MSIGTIQDISDLLRIQKESYGNIQWQRNSLNHDFLFNQRSLYLVVRDESQKVMAFIGVWMKNKEVHITNLCVSSDYQREGLATFLIELIAKIAKEKGLEIYTLEVRVSNQNAIRLYKRREFAVVGERTGYYKDNGEDALLMERQLFPRKEENYA
jgi:ribosomal-protein-alanine N-acetyltransferase